MFLILIGIILTCYGISDILVQKEMQFSEAGKVVVIFAIGFVCIVIGLIMLNKRNMELFIEATDDRMKNKKNVNVNSLIFDRTIYEKGPKVVVIGGGVALAGDILFDALKEEVKKTALGVAIDGVKFLPAALGNDAGVVGAAALFAE